MAIATPAFDALDEVAPPIRSETADGDAYAPVAEAWMRAFPVAGAQIKAIGDAAEGNAAIAEAAAAGLLNASELAATSTTNRQVGENTTKQFTFAEADREFRKGQTVNIAYAADATIRMVGVITAVDNGAKTMTVFIPAGGSEGTGTYADWIISVGGKTGADGAQASKRRAIVTFAGARVLALADLGAVLEYTGTGGHVLSGDIGVVGQDFPVGVRNAGTGYFDIDLSQDVDGKGVIRVYPGEAFELVSAAAAWRTIGRAKRVLASSIVAAAQAAMAVEAVFSDPELISLDFDLAGIRGSAQNQTLYAQLKFNGVYVATNYTSPGISTMIPIMPNSAATTSSVGGKVYMAAPLTNLAGLNNVNSLAAGASGGAGAWGGGIGADQVGPCQGIKFFWGSGNFAAGALRTYINRE